MTRIELDTLLLDDDDDPDAVRSYRDKRRNAHTQAEQKRRDAIKVWLKGIDTLLSDKEV